MAVAIFTVRTPDKKLHDIPAAEWHQRVEELMQRYPHSGLETPFVIVAKRGDEEEQRIDRELGIAS